MKEEILLLEYKKRCPCCGEYGGRDGCGFYKQHGLKKSGLRSWCVVCDNRKRCEYRKTDKGKALRRISSKKYYQSEKGKRWRKHHKQSGKSRERDHKYYKANAQKIKERIKKYKANGIIILSNNYVKDVIKKLNRTERKDITPEDILIKREQIQTKRTLKRIRKELTL